MVISIKKNIIANIVGKLWSFISVFIFVPIYISLLGIENYGVISFYTMLLSFLVFADAGLTATLSREFAKVNIEDLDYKQNLLRTFEYIYLIIGILIVFFTSVFADKIVLNFIKTETIPYDELVFLVKIMGIIVFLTLASALYQGGLMGIQRFMLSNTLVISYSFVRSALVLIPLMWINDLKFYFYWQLVTAILYLFTTRYFLMKCIRTSNPVVAKFDYLKNVWKYALGMMAMAVIASVNTQVDKLTVSNLLTLRDFTNYSLSTMVGQVILFLATPIIVAMFPELTRLISIKDEKQAKVFFHKYSYIIAAVTSAIAVVIICYTYDYILIWTGKEEIASAIQYSTKILTIGSLFLALQYTPYYLALANGHTRTNVFLGLFVLVGLVPLLKVLIPHYGIIGAAIPWLIINLLATVVLGIVLIRRFMNGELFIWLFRDSLLPIMISSIIGVLLYFVFSFFIQGWLTILYGSIIFISIIVINSVVFLQYCNVKISN